MSPRLSDLFLASQSDERLVSLARSGHERAFAAIVERYRPELQALARRLCSDDRSEDVVQQAFLSAFAALRSGAEVKHLRGWLYQIVRNAASRPRAPHCLPLDGEAASVETVEDVVQQRALAISTLTELSRLPDRQRQAMIGTALGGMGRAEIASSMGLSEGAVRQLVHRARTTLRTMVTAVTPWPLARWLTATGSGGSVGAGGPVTAELAGGAGAATSSGIAIKLGAVLASGTLVTGVAAVDLHRAPARQAHTHSTAARAHAAAQRARPLELAVLPTAASSSPPRTARIVFTARPGGARADARRGGARPREDASSARSGTRRDGQGTDGRDGGARPSDGEMSVRNDGPRTAGASSREELVSGRRRDGGSSHTASGRDGSNGGEGFGASSASITSAGSRSDGGDQSLSGSRSLDSSLDGGSSSGPDAGGSDGSSGTSGH